MAGPASAQGGDRVGAPSLKYETEVTDYVRPSTASDGHLGSPVSWVDKDLNQPDMGIREQPTQVNAPHGPPTPDESILVDLPPLAIITDLPPVTAKVPQARSAVLPELDANANTSLPEVDDEVLAGVNYEPDFFW